ncbi:L,D-transpeptidase [uncultured Clostridium sp.]|uniref:L,D-transpeptidase n=1 Tax=uncultured Clostridium sp. TaxID=59620 RepID=UPI0025FF968B|nr:L,D-transpeptidase [uncultured Clostridium sp.]
MKEISYFNFITKIKRKKNNKLIYILIMISVICLFSLWQNYRYNKLFMTFKNYFTDYNYAEANNLLLTHETYNPIKSLKLKNDLKVFFDSELSKLSSEIKDKSTDDKNILWELNEINRYNIESADEISNIASSSDFLKDSIENYNNGIKYFSKNDYTEAVSYFEKVSSLDINYSSSLKYMNKSRDSIKQNIFNYCDELSDNDYYIKAISILDENSSLIKNDVDVESKISEIKKRQQDYFDKNSEIVEASSLALTSDITPDNINSLSIQSNTQYLINVDLNNQKTYIYKGSKDEWSLIKTCPCATGISGEETPTGSFTTLEKGDWFFSNKYNQGGKYWTQIIGDILFHSVPFDRDKTTVVDYTLNEPASHGCIRLSISDSKWIYNNIPKGSKVIIK